MLTTTSIIGQSTLSKREEAILLNHEVVVGWLQNEHVRMQQDKEAYCADTQL